MIKRSLIPALLLAATGVAGIASADETTFCNAYITTLPYTISAQGHYCFDRNLSFAATSGAAITIASDFVVLDLNNFKLGGGGAGLATLAVGILSTNHSNITVRNGNIRGFATGIEIAGATKTDALNTVVEDNVLDGNTVKAIWVYGTGGTVRHNIVTNTGGSTAAVHPFFNCTLGIDAEFDFAGNGTAGAANLSGNSVSNTTAPAAGGTCVYNITATAGSVAKGNVVNAGATAGTSRIIATVCKDNVVYQTSGVAYGCTSKVGTTNFP